jgi:hypothetical protein
VKCFYAISRILFRQTGIIHAPSTGIIKISAGKFYKYTIWQDTLPPEWILSRPEGEDFHLKGNGQLARFCLNNRLNARPENRTLQSKAS